MASAVVKKSEKGTDIIDRGLALVKKEQEETATKVQFLEESLKESDTINLKLKQENRTKDELIAQLTSISKSGYLRHTLGTKLDSRLANELEKIEDFSVSAHSLHHNLIDISVKFFESRIFLRSNPDHQEMQNSTRLQHLLQLVLCNNLYIDVFDNEDVRELLFLGVTMAFMIEHVYTTETEAESQCHALITKIQSVLQELRAPEVDMKGIMRLAHVGRMELQQEPVFQSCFPKLVKPLVLRFLQTISPIFVAKNETGNEVDIISEGGLVHPSLNNMVAELETEFVKCMRCGEKARWRKTWPKALWPDQNTIWPKYIRDHYEPYSETPLVGKKLITTLPAFEMDNRVLSKANTMPLLEPQISENMKDFIPFVIGAAPLPSTEHAPAQSTSNNEDPLSLPTATKSPVTKPTPSKRVAKDDLSEQSPSKKQKISAEDAATNSVPNPHIQSSPKPQPHPENQHLEQNPPHPKDETDSKVQSPGQMTKLSQSVLETLSTLPPNSRKRSSPLLDDEDGEERPKKISRHDSEPLQSLSVERSPFSKSRSLSPIPSIARSQATRVESLMQPQTTERVTRSRSPAASAKDEEAVQSSGVLGGTVNSGIMRASPPPIPGPIPEDAEAHGELEEDLMETPREGAKPFIIYKSGNPNGAQIARPKAAKADGQLSLDLYIKTNGYLPWSNQSRIFKKKADSKPKFDEN